MNIEQIYNKFNNIGCLTFATINDKNEPQTRIAHLRAFDNEGIYFMTMITKGFYQQLKETSKVSICGLNANNKIEYNENGFPIFDKGYSITLTGEVKEISIEEIKNKNNPIFDFCIKDYEKYQAMRVFCITSAHGEIFDYDFEKSTRENKLERIYFSYNGASIKYKGLTIEQEKCIKCGICYKKCSFKAINKEDDKYLINKNRCDECGDCFLNCPTQAINISK